MNRQLQIVIAKADNGFTIRTQGDTPQDRGLFIATDASEASRLAKEQIDKSLAIAPAPAPPQQ